MLEDYDTMAKICEELPENHPLLPVRNENKPK